MKLNDLTLNNLIEMDQYHQELLSKDKITTEEQELLTAIEKFEKELGHTIKDEAKKRAN